MMANMNVFRAYKESRDRDVVDGNTNKKDELNFVSVEVSKIPQEKPQITQEVKTPIEPKKEENLKPKPLETKESSDVKKGKGRPAHNPGVTTALRTYKIAEEAIDAMEQKMFEHRKDWDKRMSLSKYITNLIWADTHNGELFYDPETAKCLVDLEEEEL